MESDFLVSRTTGTFFGLGIGAALGKPVSGLSPFEIMSRYQVIDAFYSHNHDKPGQYGTVARDAFCVAKSIYENGKIDTEDISKTITKESPLDPVFLPRIVPLAVYLSFNSVDDLTILKNCRDIVFTSQQDKNMVLPAFAIAKTIIDCIRNRKSLDNPNDMYFSDKSLLGRIIDTLQLAEKKIETKNKTLFSERMVFTRKKLQSRASTEEFLGINRNVNVDECASFSMFCFMRSPDSFNSLITAASMGGNSSINASLVGSMVGAYTGTSPFSQDFKDNVENSAKILAWGESFVDKFFKEE